MLVPKLGMSVLTAICQNVFAPLNFLSSVYSIFLKLKGVQKYSISAKFKYYEYNSEYILFNELQKPTFFGLGFIPFFFVAC